MHRQLLLKMFKIIITISKCWSQVFRVESNVIMDWRPLTLNSWPRNQDLLNKRPDIPSSIQFSQTLMIEVGKLAYFQAINGPFTFFIMNSRTILNHGCVGSWINGLSYSSCVF